MKHALAALASAASLATAFTGGSCSSGTTCALDSSGYYVCDMFASAYPYDYAYYDPYYVTAWGYYPYFVDTYYDPYGYTYVYQASSAPVPTADPTMGSNVPELLDKAHRAANAVDAGVLAALNPIKDLMKAQPTQSNDTVVYGPADYGGGNYQFTMRQASASDKRYGWKLEARPNASSGSFSLVAAGTIQVGEQPRRGRGAFGVDCGALSAADASVACRGTLLMGFAHTNEGDKILEVRLGGYTPDMNANTPLDATVFDWRLGDDSANHVRLVMQTNLSGTTTLAPETVAIKLSYLEPYGVRADAVATGGDIASGQMYTVSTCVPPNLDQSQGVTSSGMCNSDGTGCTGTSITCPAPLQAFELPNPDPTASDPPTGMPEMPAAPGAMPDGSGN
jgi:hypothetical protein